MAEQAEVKIITADAVTNLAELRKAIKEAKENLEGLNVGSVGYRSQLGELIKMQNLMRGAMNGTTASFDTLKESAEGTTKTYNGLVNEMAKMKRELRNIDVSTEEGAEHFRKLASDINAVNDELKEMDAMKGDFQRNVGNYQSAFSGLAEKTDVLSKGLGAATGGINGFKDGAEALSKSPAIASVGILVSLAMRLATEVQKNDEAMAAVKKGMEALKPVMDFFQGLLDKVIDIVVDLIEKASAFLGSSGIFNKIINGVMGVGNAILQFVVAPFKGIASAIKVFQEEGVKGIGKAAKAFGAEMKNGVSFKQNFATGQAFADGIISGAKSRKPEAAKAGKELADEATKAMEERVKAYVEKVKAQKEAEKYLKDLRESTAKDSEEALKELNAQFDAETEAFLAQMEDEAEAERIIQEQSVKNAEEAAKKKVAALNAYASGASSLMTSIADLYESDTDLTEREARRVKNLRVAAATIDMIQGAVTAYSTAMELGPIAGPIVGAANAAAVVAAGMANIAKIKSTSVSADASSDSVSTSATVTAPATTTSVPTTTVTEGASQTTRLNRAASPQKVYILQSDIEAAGNASKTQVAESSF